MQVAVSDCVIFLVLSAFNNTSQVKELWHQVFIICLPPLRFDIFLTFSLLYLNVILSLTTLHTHVRYSCLQFYFILHFTLLPYTVGPTTHTSYMYTCKYFLQSYLQTYLSYTSLNTSLNTTLDIAMTGFGIISPSIHLNAITSFPTCPIPN